jgi:transcriptional regulator with XRE-family HTH domain
MGKAAGTNGAVSRKTTEVDIEIGRRLRFRRIELNLSQNTLAERLSITQGQLVKYETGANRISASRLSDCARVLEVSVTYFFDSDIAPIPDAPRSGIERELFTLCRKLSKTSLVHLFRIAQTFVESDRERPS